MICFKISQFNSTKLSMKQKLQEFNFRSETITVQTSAEEREVIIKTTTHKSNREDRHF